MGKLRSPALDDLIPGDPQGRTWGQLDHWLRASQGTSLFALFTEQVGGANRWTWGYAHLKAFVDVFHHANVPIRPPNSWQSDPQWLKLQQVLQGLAPLVRLSTATRAEAEPCDLHDKISRLHKWVIDLTGDLRRKAVSAQRRTELLKLGVDATCMFDKRWQRSFDALKSYVDRHGRPPTPSENRAICMWIQYQKKQFEQISAVRRRCLRSLHGWPWNKKPADTWQRHFDELREYISVNGTSMVPGFHKLHNYVYRLRAQYRKGILGRERVKLLDTIGFVWDATSFRPTGELWHRSRRRK